MWHNPGWEQDLWGCPSHAEEIPSPLCTPEILLQLILLGSVATWGYCTSRNGSAPTQHLFGHSGFLVVWLFFWFYCLQSVKAPEQNGDINACLALQRDY